MSRAASSKPTSPLFGSPMTTKTWIAIVLTHLIFVLLVLLLQERYWSQFWIDSNYRGPRNFLYHLAGAALAGIVVTIATSVTLAPTIAAEPKLPPRTVARSAFVSLVLVTGLALPLVTSLFILDSFPNSGDEYSFVHQARGLADGEFWYEPPPLGRAMVAMRTWVFENRWVGQYSPGWPLLLAIGEWLYLPPAVVGPILGAGTTGLLLLILWRWSDPWTAIALSAIFATSAFYIFNAGSFFSHIPTALFVLTWAVIGRTYLERPTFMAAFLVGMSLGAIGLIRTYTALLLGLLFAAAMLWRRRKTLKTDWLIALGGLPFLCLLLGYNYRVMGDPFVSTYAADFESEQIRFMLSLGVFKTTVRFAEEFVAWTSPVLVLLFVAAFVAKLFAKRLAFYDLVLPLFIIAYVVQGWDGGNRYGPRYYADIYPVIFLTIATGLPALYGRLGYWGRCAGPHVVIIALLYGLSALPYVGQLLYTVVRERQDPYKLAAEAKLDDAIVLLKSPSGLASAMNIYDLARNTPGLRDPVLYANGLETDVTALRKAFPNRSIWIYERPADSALGTLRPAP